MDAFSSANVILFPRQQSWDQEKKWEWTSKKEGLISQVDARSKADKYVLLLIGGGSNWRQPEVEEMTWCEVTGRHGRGPGGGRTKLQESLDEGW